MNAAIVPFRLLIINDSQREAQRLTSMFQNAGKPCRAQHINTEEAFNKIIEEQGWDLVIAHSDAKSLTPAAAIRAIRKYNHDLPVILLTDDDSDRSVVDGMKLGACDVVQLDDDQHLLLVVSRELSNRQHRKDTRAAERKVRELERRNRQLLDSSKDGIAFVQDGMFIYANDSFAEMCGYEVRGDIEYVPLMDMIKDDDQEHVKSSLKNFLLKSESEKETRLSFHIEGSSGELKKIEVELQLSHFEEEPCIQFFLHASIADNEVLEAEIESFKYTDNVTGLYNRAHLNDALVNLVDESASKETSHALFLVDIDQFEEKVTSAVGIDGADECLATVAGFLQAHSNTEDTLARFGDHSFAIVSDESNLEKLLNTGNVLCELIREHFFEIKSKTIRLTASIGIAIINETSIDAQAVINQAGQAIESLRNQQDNGTGNGANLYQEEEGEQTVLVGALQKAMKEDRFKLLFQPIISLRGDETERYEVLLRMLDENDEEISPSHFIQTAESMQIVTKIDRWVILEAIKHLSNHNKKAGHAQLLVHISHHTLCDDSVLPWLKVAFQAAKVDPSTLVLQAKETEVTQHLTAAKKFIEESASLGIGFCISHFGCELDPLALLDHIDIESIKIDGSFSLEMQENPDNTEAIEKLLSSLQERQKIITVPMVENASILSKLWKMGIHCIQGNYLQPPGAAMDYEFAVENAG
jgi:diguanylate cyclase (GGDEF)-like protein/PAS domain S-box-containing protein